MSMCKSGAMWLALPAMPLMMMAKMADSWSKKDCGTPSGEQEGAGCCPSEPQAGDWAITVRKRRQGQRSVVETAVQAGAFKTLVTALRAADLVPALEGEGPFTVFAPTDEAFARLPAGTLEGLLQDKQKLAAVLKYHVASGELTSDDLEGVATAKTLQGQGLPVDTSLGVRVGSAFVIKADIGCTNGVIHAIDSVLLPD